MARCCDCCEDSIEDYDVDDLLDEINSRLRTAKYQTEVKLIYIDELNHIRRAIQTGNLAEADHLFCAAVMPKWKDLEECRKAWLKAVAPPPPPPKVGLWQHVDQ